MDYKQYLFILADILRQLKDFADKLELASLVSGIDNILTRLETDSFSLAVIGEFKRGKSTFINALLGEAVLPADIVPTTATLNRITYGLQKKAKICFKNGQTEIISISELTNYVTKLNQTAEKTAASIKEAIVYYPNRFCQENNLTIIDTPGLSDEANLTELTLSILPQVDVAIFVVMALSPLSETEQEFLKNHLLTQDLARVIVIVTGIDRCNSPQDVIRVINLVKQRIQTQIIQKAKQTFGEKSPRYQAYLSKIGQLKVFGLSAYQALQGKIKGDINLLRESQFLPFEFALKKFLSEERGLIFLQVPVNKAIATAREILKAIHVQRQALLKEQSAFDAKCQQLLTTLQTQKEQLKQQTFSNEIFSKIEQINNQILEIKVMLEKAKTKHELKLLDLEKIKEKTQKMLQELQVFDQELRKMMGIFCPNCTRLNQAHNNFCNFCGTRLK